MRGAALIAALGALFAGSAEAQDAGLAAWERIYATLLHPRCSNCHVGDSGRPGWRGLGYGEKARHGMAVQAGESRIGAESTPCRTCHITSNVPNTVPHAPPVILVAWRLPPVSMVFADRSSTALCAQLKGQETQADLVEHISKSPFVAWGFTPGAARAAAPGSVTALLADITVWGGAGMPCPNDP